ncbi:hypothetical protein [uncultured Maribacter sp.]|uniref:hypothetical protein n=1 Tax=uncultured Maribacter sp. TaxID=431308 RepID=UPI00261A6D77|nr:hypothetical protein [uncultured Maribacter sp.]
MEKFAKQRRLHTLKRQLNATIKQVEQRVNRNSHLQIEQTVKTELERTVKRFVKQEITKIKTKTNDWYFDDTLNKIYRQRNSLAKNRYFIVDTVNVPIGGSTPSFYGEQRIRELPITHAEISRRISSSAAIFAKMLQVTVSKEENAKIWNAYDTVDEKTIFTVTLGLPVAIIAGVELLPAMYVYAKPAVIAEAELIGSSGTYIKSILSTRSLGLTLNSSLGSGLGHFFGDATAQYVGNGFDYKKVDPYRAAVSGVFKFSASSVFMRSVANSREKNNYMMRFSESKNIAVDFSFGMLGGGINKEIGSFGLMEFNKSMGGYLEHTMRIGINSTKTTVANKTKKEIKSEKNNK